MRIYDDLQLDYCDVLLRPKRSALTSRSEVDILREYTFKWCYDLVDEIGKFEIGDTLIIIKK